MWSRSKGSSVRKVQLLIEYLEKDNKRGLKELVITEFVETETLTLRPTPQLMLS